MFDNSFPACAFPSSSSFFFEVEISSCKLIPLFRPGSINIGSVSWDNCNWMFPDELHVSSFLDKIPTLCLDSGIVSPLRLHWVKGVCMFRCNLPPALLAEWPGSLMCHCGNTGVEQTLNKVSTQSWLRKKKFSCRSCWDSSSQPSDHKSGALPTGYPGSQFFVRRGIMLLAV